MSLKVSVEEKGKGTYVIYPEGSIDVKTYTILGNEVDEILKKSPGLIIFDMKDVSFVSSAGIGIILVAEKDLKLQGGQLLMVHVPPPIRKVLDIVQALPSQQIFASVQEMDAYLKEIQRKVKEGEIE